jgi:hypothetical protein
METFELPAGALVIGEPERAKLHALREAAAAAPVHMPDLLVRMKTDEGREAHRDAMTRQSVTIPTRYVVTLSIETGHPMGTARHLSVSSRADGRVPTPEAVWMIAEELGFTGGIRECKVWMEDLSDGGRAVNIAQPVGIGAAGRA